MLKIQSWSTRVRVYWRVIVSVDDVTRPPHTKFSNESVPVGGAVSTTEHFLATNWGRFASALWQHLCANCDHWSELRIRVGKGISVRTRPLAQASFAVLAYCFGQPTQTRWERLHLGPLEHFVLFLLGCCGLVHFPEPLLALIRNQRTIWLSADIFTPGADSVSCGPTKAWVWWLHGSSALFWTA